MAIPKAMMSLLTTEEQELIVATEPRELDKLDEDELLKLHKRVRRARNKYTKLHRRQGASRVAKDKARGVARESNQRTAVKAEVFEDGLGRVSSKLSTAARKNAAALRKDRIAASQKAKAATKKAASKTPAAQRGKGSRASAGAKQQRAQHLKAPIRKQKNASVLAKGKRRQAKRDSR